MNCTTQNSSTSFPKQLQSLLPFASALVASAQFLQLHSVTSLVQHQPHCGQAFLPLQALLWSQSGQGGLSWHTCTPLGGCHNTPVVSSLQHATCTSPGSQGGTTPAKIKQGTIGKKPLICKETMPAASDIK